MNEPNQPDAGAVPNIAATTPPPAYSVGAPLAVPDGPPSAAAMNSAAGPGTAPAQVLQQSRPQVSQPAVNVATGMTQGPLPPSAPTSGAAGDAVSDDESSQDDVVWVNRAKRIIAQTQGDPHRQVQLLQQLSVVFLKERYGRSVHTDDK